MKGVTPGVEREMHPGRVRHGEVCNFHWKQSVEISAEYANGPGVRFQWEVSDSRLGGGALSTVVSIAMT